MGSGRAGSAILGAALLWAAPLPAGAGGAPAQLYNKTVVLNWSRDVTETGSDGRTFTVKRDDRRDIYVSTAGRLFARSIGRAGRRQQSKSEFAPGENRTAEGLARELTFQGNRLVGNFAHYSGATHVTVDFAPDFRSCTMNVISGKLGNTPIVWKGADGKPYQVVSSVITSSSCMVVDGNVFAGN